MSGQENIDGNRSSFFTSAREKRLWLWVLAVIGAIYATLFMGRPLANQLRDQNVQAVFFVLGMLLVAAAVIAHGLKAKPSRLEWSIILGITAVYLMLIFRLGAPERSHLIEYSVLAVFIYSALVERLGVRFKTLQIALLAWGLAFAVGVLDECFQFFLPNRTFDPEDIVFNGMAVTMAILASLLLTWGRKRLRKP